MARTLDHWICPKCKNNFRTVGSIDPEEEKCGKCGEQMECWACLEFHHVGKKDLEISSAINNAWTKVRILAEIEKCDVLCSNCHRKRHWNEKTGPWVWRN